MLVAEALRCYETRVLEFTSKDDAYDSRKVFTKQLEMLKEGVAKEFYLCKAELFLHKVDIYVF